jgi:hypothetical protein
MKQKDRQIFLQNAVNRNLLVRKLETLKIEAEVKALKDESELIEELIQVINIQNVDTSARLKRKLMLKSILKG